jgi:D-inositol-3-phosphate glycosyltransferase
MPNEATELHRNRTKPVLLAVGFHVESTGLTRVMRSILERLETRYDIHQIGIGYRGAPRRDGIHLYPSNLHGGDVFGAYQCRSLVERLRPDVVFILLDFWMLSSYMGFLDGVVGSAKVVTYSPLDGTLLDSGTVAALSGVDRLGVYTEFARRQVEQAVAAQWRGRPAPEFPQIEVIPHGVDTETFHPLSEADRLNVRRRLLEDEPDPAGSFVVLNANRPRERKRMDLTIEGFARFAAGKPPGVKLYLHHARGEEEERRMILDLARQHGIADRLLVNPLGAEPSHATDGELNELYNACDVGLNTSMGEGWGLVSCEHAATGAAQVVPRHSACEELWTGAAELVETVEDVSFPGLPLGLRAVSAEGVAAALDRLYQQPGHRRRLAEAGYRRAIRPEYRWPEIADRWHRLFQQLLETPAVDLKDPARRGGGRVARVRRAGRLDEQEMDLLAGHRTVLHPSGHDEQLARAERDAAVPHLDGEMPAEDQEEVVRIVVLVPDELPLHLDDHEVMAVELADGPRLPVL